MLELNNDMYNGIKYVPEDLTDVCFMHVRDNLDDPICPKCGVKGIDTNKETPDGIQYYNYMESNAYRILIDKIKKISPEILSGDSTDPIMYSAIYLDDNLIRIYDPLINDIFCECKNYWSAITGKIRSGYIDYVVDTMSKINNKHLPLGARLLIRERKMHFIKRHYRCNCCGKEWDSNFQLDMRYYNPKNISTTKWT